jgi:hypothetical protein
MNVGTGLQSNGVLVSGLMNVAWNSILASDLNTAFAPLNKSGIKIRFKLITKERLVL